MATAAPERPRRSLAFLARPRWLAFHLVVAGLVVGCLAAALWQFGRLDERRTRNRAITALAAAGPVEVPAGPLPPEWTPVVVAGRWLAADQVLVRNRSFEGTPGYHVVTPLVRADGTAVLVNRGWIPNSAAPPSPDSGPVSVVGRVRTTQERGRIGPRDPAEGRLEQVVRVDVARIARQTSAPVVEGAYVELESQVPADRSPDAPRPLPLPVLDDGPHLSYALQWCTFALMAVVGWFVVVRSAARHGGTRPRRHRRRVEVIDRTAERVGGGAGPGG